MIIIGVLGTLVLPLEVCLARANYAGESSAVGPVEPSKKSQSATSDLTFENTVISTAMSNEHRIALDAWHRQLAQELVTRFDKDSQSLATGLGQRSVYINYKVENGELVSSVCKKSSGYRAFDSNLSKALRSLNKSSFLELPIGLTSISETIKLTRDLGPVIKKAYTPTPTKFPSCFPKTN